MAVPNAVREHLKSLSERLASLPGPLERILVAPTAPLVEEVPFEDDATFVQYLQLQASAWLWKRK